jgi:peptidyl-prolyl cis-trans isomerase D
MLQELRDHAKSWLSYLLLILLVISFGIWGIGDIFRSTSTKDWVAKVAGTKIHPNTLTREFNNQVGQLRSMLGSEFTNKKAKELGLVERALSQLVTITALNLEANRLGLNISREQIVRVLESTPQLRNSDGSFNRAMFERLIQNQGMNEAGFIDTQKQIAARNLIIRGFAAPIVVPDLVLNDIAAAQSQRRVAELVRFNPHDLNVADPSSGELETYFEANKNDFMAPERRTFKALSITAKDVSKDIGVSDEEIKAAYAEQKDQFEIPEKRTLTQAVVADEEKAKALLASAKKGGLANAAKEMGSDSVKLDDVVKKDLPVEFAVDVFAAKANEVSGPVKTALGWHVFVVNSVTAAKSLTLDEAHKQIREKLQADKSAEVMVQTANKIDDMLAGGKKLDEIGSSLGLNVVSYTDRDAAGNEAGKSAKEDVAFADDVLRAAFQYQEGEISPLIESKAGGYVVVEVKKIVPTHVEEMANVKDRVKTAWLKMAKTKKATEEAQKVVAQMQEGKSLSALTGTGLKKSTSAAIAIDDQQQKDVPREALSPLFGLGKGEATMVSTPEGELVVRVKDILPGEEKDIAIRKAALKNRLIQEWSGLHAEEYTHALRDFYPVEVDKKMIDRLFSDSNS